MLYPGGWGCSGGSKGIQRDGRGCSCIQRDPWGWEGLFLLPTAPFPIPTSGTALETQDLIRPTSVGPRSPGMGACSQSSIPAIPEGRIQDPKEPRTAPSQAFPLQSGFLTPWSSSAPLQVKVPALWVTLWSVQQPREIFHPGRCLRLPSRKSCTKGSLRWIQEQSSARDEKITALPFRTNTQLSPP